jgi:IclR family transcriptional regulator, blcABC operon repressor
VTNESGRGATGDAEAVRPSLRDVSSSAPAVTRAASLLGILAEPGIGPLGPSELARRLDLPKSSVANLCSALEEVGFLSRLEGRYELGHRLLELGGAYSRQADLLSIFRTECRRLPMASAETVQVAMLDGTEIVYLARHDGSQPVRLASEIGGRMPAVCTGLGKAMLAALDPRIVEDRLRHVPFFPALTPNSIHTSAELTAELDRVRARGYAIDDEENTIGIVCYAVALRGHDPQARPRAVSATLLKARATDALRDALVDDLRRLAATLESRL